MRNKKRKEDQGDDGRRSYRFDPKLWAEFEDRCALNIYNPRAVLEAMVVDWLSSDETHHKELAKKYKDWMAKNKNQ